MVKSHAREYKITKILILKCELKYFLAGYGEGRASYNADNEKNIINSIRNTAAMVASAADCSILIEENSKSVAN